MPVLLLELNEINFDYVRTYGRLGKLPALNCLIADHGVSNTISEQAYENLEPWIQWVTAHTGLPLSEHGVRRLGDIVNHDIDQIWEILERQGLKVGAVSPMNASNRCKDPAFFVPDPWTGTTVSGSRMLSRLHKSVSQAVNDNAKANITAKSAVGLLGGLMRFARIRNCGGYLADLRAAINRRPWRRAMLLDRLLCDILITQTKSKSPDFASLFLNAGAHIQHHYLFNSAAYNGVLRNPDWYLKAGEDPVLDVYSLYDSIVADIRRSLPGYRLILATGLRQEPHDEVTLYWRLKDHAAFLSSLAIPFQRVEPRMSRDFVVFCHDEYEANMASRILTAIKSEEGEPIFEVDNRGTSLFVMLVWAKDIDPDFICRLQGNEVHRLYNDVAFVAIKNGKHNGIGHFVDTGETVSEGRVISLCDVPSIIASACGGHWPNQDRVASNRQSF